MQGKLVAIEDIDVSKDHLLRVEWNLGKRCNFDCSYCGASTHDATSNHLSWNIIEKTIKKLGAISQGQKKKLKLSLTGGEPYLHPQFIKILQLAKAEGVSRISVTTNGSVHLKIYEESLNYLDYLVVSYHLEYARRQKVLQNILDIKKHLAANYAGARKNLHVHIMLLPGHFEETQEIVKQLRAHDIPFVFRRIRPQFDANGDFLKPYSSGLIGTPRARKDLQGSYYSDQELALMENLA
jgi:MoaA/NifB/PqqE/SkfB family radical SAM enzyme